MFIAMRSDLMSMVSRNYMVFKRYGIHRQFFSAMSLHERMTINGVLYKINEGYPLFKKLFNLFAFDL